MGKWFVWHCTIFSLLLVLLDGTYQSDAAAAHTHTNRLGSAEKEEDGAYSPRDKTHRDTSGEHSSDFDHEAILGSHKKAEEFDHLSPEESKRRLGILLTKMDLSNDGNISRDELKAWILRSFSMLSEEESSDRLQDADENNDGQVTWKEYLADTFGVSPEEIGNSEEVKLIHDDKIMFDMADQNKDGFLDRKEFLLFSHPEEHPEMLPLILQNTLDDKDTNKDGFIDFQEYVGEKAKDRSQQWLAEEKAKFDEDYDKDSDGRLNQAEILAWMVPSNDDIAEEEVVHLFSECDVNEDGFISFEEAIEQYETFVGSEATDYGDHLHNIHTFQDEL